MLAHAGKVLIHDVLLPLGNGLGILGQNGYSLTFFLAVIAGIDYNFNYPGYDLVKINNVSSITDCQNKCLNYDGCDYYTYRTPDFACFLKTKMSRQGVASHYSGQKIDYYFDGKENIFTVLKCLQLYTQF